MDAENNEPFFLNPFKWVLIFQAESTEDGPVV